MPKSTTLTNNPTTFDQDHIMKTLAVIIVAIATLALPARHAAAQGFQLPNMQVRSSAFEDGGTIPIRFTSHGQNVQPDFRITGAPDTAKSFVIIMHDIEVALGGNPDDVTHWVAFNIPSPNIPEGKLPEGSVTGNNIQNKPVYMGSGAPLKDRLAPLRVGVLRAELHARPPGRRHPGAGHAGDARQSGREGGVRRPLRQRQAIS